MAKNSIRDFDNTAGNNTDIQSVDISEGCSPAGINNALREMMADLADVNDGTVALESPQADSLTVTGDLTVDTDTLHVDSTNNNVGIGEAASSSYKLSVDGNVRATKLWVRTAGDATSPDFAVGGDNNTGMFSAGTNALGFTTNGSEHMRIGSSGDIMAGTTSEVQAESSGTGLYYDVSKGSLQLKANGNVSIVANRVSSDGVIAQFRKDGSTVGSIGNVSTRAYFVSDTAGISPFGGVIYPTNGSGTAVNNTIDLGAASYRWRDIYTTGAVNTSDQNEKQQIASLTDAEIAAAKRISALFKTFKWNDAVAEKGDNARTHAGVIAQDVKAALVAEGLDAGDYAFWCSNTWWEADEAYTDDDGNAQTRTNTYDTQADAPAGATERTLQSVRYNELLAFVGAATEQRMADLETAKADFETRIAALEAN